MFLLFLYFQYMHNIFIYMFYFIIKIREFYFKDHSGYNASVKSLLSKDWRATGPIHGSLL